MPNDDANARERNETVAKVLEAIAAGLRAGEVSVDTWQTERGIIRTGQGAHISSGRDKITLGYRIKSLADEADRVAASAVTAEMAEMARQILEQSNGQDQSTPEP